MMELLTGLREAITQTVQSSLPEPHASLLLGMILGVTSDFPAGFYEALRATGTLHIVVVSGFNITILINFLMKTLLFLPLRARFLAVVPAIAAYVLLVGPEPPVVRAALMGSIALLATVFGRQNYALRTLLLAGGVMVLLNPSWIGELSFQLSFLATLGLIAFYPWLDRAIPRRGGFLREGMVQTLSAQILVWPLLAYHFGQVSWLSPVVNALVLWTVPILTTFGLVATTLALVVSNIKEMIMIPLLLILEYFIRVVSGVSSLKVALVPVAAFSPLALGFYYLILWAGKWFIDLTSQKRSETA